jgi:large subunit ribosomal protein L9
MEVILLERVEKLGAIGDVVKVKNGFARNYLLPNKKALRANDANRKLFETNRARIEKENDEKRADAEKASKGVEGKSVQLIRQASNVGHLYGSVSARDIAEALEGVGAKVAKSQVVLDRPIKAIGMHEVKVALHPEVSVTVKVNVARSPEEADLQAQGVDVLQQMFEEQAAPMAAEDLAPVDETAEPAEAEGEATGEAPAEETAEAAPEAAETPAEEAPESTADASVEEGKQPEA